MRAGPASDDWQRLELLAAQDAGRAAFDPTAISDAGPVTRRYLTAAIAPGTPRAAGARLAMRGRIKIGRWLPFRARQLLVPARGTVWIARVAGVITGSDRYLGGRGAMSWKLLGLVPIVRADGPDVSRSTAERAAAESVWVPTAVARSDAVVDVGVDRVRVTIVVDDHRVDVDHDLDGDGRVTSSSLHRWGDPDRTGTWSELPFGVEVTGHRTFGGVTIPASGRAGWHYGTDRWNDGVFFEYELTDYQLLA